MATRFGEQHEVLTQTVVRFAIVAVTFGIAAGIPNFGDVVSLIGARPVPGWLRVAWAVCCG
jgi:hypothetical protein